MPESFSSLDAHKLFYLEFTTAIDFNIQLYFLWYYVCYLKALGMLEKNG